MIADDRKGLNYWPSFVDIFASLFFIFLILFAVFYIKEVRSAEAAKRDIDDLKKMISSLDVTKQSDKGKLVIQAELLFDLDMFFLREEGKQFAGYLAQKISSFFATAERQKKYAIVIEGHTDRSGDVVHNYDLSIKRAVSFITEIEDNLSNELHGKLEFIPAGFGESMPEVETKDGIKEARNRRVVVRIIPKFDKTIFNSQPVDSGGEAPYVDE